MNERTQCAFCNGTGETGKKVCEFCQGMGYWAKGNAAESLATGIAITAAEADFERLAGQFADRCRPDVDASSLGKWTLEGIAHTRHLDGLPEHIRETTETDTWAVFECDGELRLVPRDEVEP